MPQEIIERSVEIGRACVSQKHRNIKVLYLLWKGLCSYLQKNGKTFLIGCTSISTQDPVEGMLAMEYLKKHNYYYPGFFVNPRPGFECRTDKTVPKETANFNLPRLFKAYLNHGTLACSAPAIDRAFKTIDFLVICNPYEIDERMKQFFFGNANPPCPGKS